MKRSRSAPMTSAAPTDRVSVARSSKGVLPAFPDPGMAAGPMPDHSDTAGAFVQTVPPTAPLGHGKRMLPRLYIVATVDRRVGHESLRSAHQEKAAVA